VKVDTVDENDRIEQKKVKGRGVSEEKRSMRCRIIYLRLDLRIVEMSQIVESYGQLRTHAHIFFLLRYE
jgi:hypothetical protein